MRFLLHGVAIPAVTAVLREMGHHADDQVSNGLPYEQLLELCHARQLDVITADPALARFAGAFGGRFDRCVVFLQAAEADAQGQAIRRLFDRYRRLSPRKLYTVTGSRVKVRQFAARQ